MKSCLPPIERCHYDLHSDQVLTIILGYVIIKRYRISPYWLLVVIPGSPSNTLSIFVVVANNKYHSNANYIFTGVFLLCICTDKSTHISLSVAYRKQKAQIKVF